MNIKMRIKKARVKTAAIFAKPLRSLAEESKNVSDVTLASSERIHYSIHAEEKEKFLAEGRRE